MAKQMWRSILKQNEDFELIPSDDKDWWNVRILKGHYTETVIRFGSIAEVKDKDELNFSFEIVSSPIEGLVEDDCAELVGEVLYECMMYAVDASIEKAEKERTDK